MRGFRGNISLKKIIWTIVCLICLITVGILQVISGRIKKGLTHEQVASTWDSDGGYAQISVYLSESEKLSMLSDLETQEYLVLELYYNLLSDLEEASITVGEEASESARLLVYGYSSQGSITMESDRTTVTFNAYGVGGDFFLFHPLKLKYGSYFSGDDVMQDVVIIDEEAAWQLFGSSDVVGKYIYIQDIPHKIVGVYERDSGYMNDAAGNGESTVYVSKESLYLYGTDNGLQTIEFLLPNPVSGYALNLVTDALSSRDVSIVENSNRYDLENLVAVLKEFGTRSMGLSGVIFPYWENIARGYEDILAGILFMQVLILSFVLIVEVIILWRAWLRRKWRTRDIITGIGDFVYEGSANRRKKKNEKLGIEENPFVLLTFDEDEYEESEEQGALFYDEEADVEENDTVYDEEVNEEEDDTVYDGEVNEEENDTVYDEEADGEEDDTVYDREVNEETYDGQNDIVC
ncbi:MAG: ABC transporter permease [Lachnospiraceae bacterium]|nr:ABC transporter permease [Lachnospiraceae bacterium]